MPRVFLFYYPFFHTSWPSFCFVCITVTYVQLDPCVSSVHLGPISSIAQQEPGHRHRGDLRRRSSDPRGREAYRGPGTAYPALLREPREGTRPSSASLGLLSTGRGHGAARAGTVG